jgi:hypothetical protein
MTLRFPSALALTLILASAAAPGAPAPTPAGTRGLYVYTFQNVIVTAKVTPITSLSFTLPPKSATAAYALVTLFLDSPNGIGQAYFEFINTEGEQVGIGAGAVSAGGTGNYSAFNYPAIIKLTNQSQTITPAGFPQQGSVNTGPYASVSGVLLSSVSGWPNGSHHPPHS